MKVQTTWLRQRLSMVLCVVVALLLLPSAAWAATPAPASWEEPGDLGSLSAVRRMVRADVGAAAELTGRGVGVALIDSGVVPVEGLTDGVVIGPDLSLESQHPAVRHLDTYGHGTHMAGIIAGGAGNSPAGLRGVAPDATLVSLKVAAANGAVDVSQVIAAIDWVVTHRDEHDIRVLALAYGTDSTQPSTIDPLAHAVESAWRAGIVVVAAAGNGGDTTHHLTSPASDPWVLAVGSSDHAGTPERADDTVSAFSNRGTARKPDLVAPGRSIVSLRVPGSHLDQQHPVARVGDRQFRGSGTSQATAVTAGAAALLLEERPELTPDQIKALLVANATRLNGAARGEQGGGLLDVAAAVAAPVTRQRGPALQPSTGTGSLEAARGSAHISLDGVELTGERDIFGQPWSGETWAPLAAEGRAWSGGDWNGSTWAGAAPVDAGAAPWSGVTWSGVTWSGVTWSGVTWSGVTWSGVTWSGVTWSGVTWSGVTWSGLSWSGVTWSGVTWSGDAWSSATWG